MLFQLVSSKEKARKRADTRAEMITFSTTDGEPVCYHQPHYKKGLDKLNNAIYSSKVLEKLKSRFYKIESNHGYINKVIPAVEYYKTSLTQIRDNLHTIMISKNEINRSIDDIQQIYKQRKELLPGGQSKLSFEQEIYKLRSDILTFVFSNKAILDILANLFQTIYGPENGQYTTFNGFMKQLIKENGAVKDEELLKYINENIEWFYLLKDVRDFLAHYGALRFGLKEHNKEKIIINMFPNIEVLEFVNEVEKGMNNFLDFIDIHHSKLINSA